MIAVYMNSLVYAHRKDSPWRQRRNLHYFPREANTLLADLETWFSSPSLRTVRENRRVMNRIYGKC